MTDVFFCFDTEDYSSDYSSNAIVGIAQLLSQEGVRASFNTVGYLARELVRNGRQDVLDALKKHEIDFHSLRHSMHPTICEYTDIENFQAAYFAFVRQEAEGMGMVKAATGVDRFYAAVPPGRSLSYVAMYAYADLGIPLYVASFFATPDGSGVHFCNGFHTDYHYYLEKLFYAEKQPDLDELLDEMATKKRVFLANHPNMILYKTFWDRVNYDKGNHCEMYQWKEAPRRDAQDVEKFYEGVRRLVRKLQADPRFTFRCTADIAKQIEPENHRVIQKQMLPVMRQALKKHFGPAQIPVSVSLSDMFFACAHFLNAEEDYPAGRVHGFLSEPIGVSQTHVVTAKALRNAAKTIDKNAFIPRRIQVGDTWIGPADFLYAALDVLTTGKDEVTIEPRRQQMDLTPYPTLKNMNLKGIWIHADSFQDNYLSDRLRLQAWTIRPEV